MQASTLTAIGSAFVASGATLLLAVSPALVSEAALPVVTELPRVVIVGKREAHVVELPRVVIEARRERAGALSVAASAEGAGRPTMRSPQAW